MTNTRNNSFFFIHAGDGIRDYKVTGVQTCALPICPQVALSILVPDNPYRYMQIRGKVVDATETGADAHIDSLAKKYLGQDKIGRAPCRERCNKSERIVDTIKTIC